MSIKSKFRRNRKVLVSFYQKLMYWFRNRKVHRIVLFDSPNKCTIGTEIERWGCCCTCKHRKMVYMHCTLDTPFRKGCTCSKELGIYVCTIMHDIDDSKIQVCGEHGCCELYKKRSE